MMKKSWASALFLAFWASSSHSEPFTYGATGNAAALGLQWGMGTVLPQNPGLTVNNVLYRYTITKDPNADALVHVQNENAMGAGYIFRETDDWSGLPGNTIVKNVPTGNIPIEYWGLGSMEVEGEGTLSNASVVYNYTIDLCFNPQTSPICEGYVKPRDPTLPEFDIYDALNDDAVRLAMQETDTSIYEDEEEQEENDDTDERKRRLERGLAASANALAMGINQALMLSQMNSRTDLAMYYNASIQGGAYGDAVTLVDKEIPDNKRALRNNFAQQVLHDKMIQMQYSR